MYTIKYFNKRNQTKVQKRIFENFSFGNKKRIVRENSLEFWLKSITRHHIKEHRTRREKWRPKSCMIFSLKSGYTHEIDITVPPLDKISQNTGFSNLWVPFGGGRVFLMPL